MRSDHTDTKESPQDFSFASMHLNLYSHTNFKTILQSAAKEPRYRIVNVVMCDSHLQTTTHPYIHQIVH